MTLQEAGNFDAAGANLCQTRMMKGSIFPKLRVCIKDNNPTRHMVSFIDFNSQFLANFQT